MAYLTTATTPVILGRPMSAAQPIIVTSLSTAPDVANTDAITQTSATASIQIDAAAILASTSGGFGNVRLLDLRDAQGNMALNQIALWLAWAHTSEVDATTPPVVAVLGRCAAKDPMAANLLPADLQSAFPTIQQGNWWRPLVSVDGETDITLPSVNAGGDQTTAKKLRQGAAVLIPVRGITHILVSIRTAAAFTGAPAALKAVVMIQGVA